MECDWAQRMWFASPLKLKLHNLDHFDFIGWLADNLRNKDIKSMEMISVIIYGIWNARNLLIFQNKILPINEVLSRSLQSISSYQTRNLKLSSKSSNASSRSDHCDNCWKPPAESDLKLNVDAHRLGDGRWGFGFVLRRSDGRPVVVTTRTVYATVDPCMAEALGIQATLDWVQANGWNNVIIESDAKTMVDSNNTQIFHRGYLGKVGKDCLRKMESLRVTLRWVRRSGNWTAHETAKWAEIEPNKDWSCNFPTPIFKHIQNDMSFLINQ